MSTGAAGGWAAAHMHGAEHLDGETPDGRQFPVPLCICRSRTCRRGRTGGAYRVWRSDLAPGDVVEAKGLSVTSVPRTAFDLARCDPRTFLPDPGAASLAESVVHVDALLGAADVTVDAVRRYAARHERRAGSVRARKVLDLAEPGSRSPGETRFRLFWQEDAGLPRPVVNRTIVDDGGRTLACVDLLDADAGLVGEYDGEHHAPVRQRAIDNARAEALVAVGLRVVRVTATDLLRFRNRTVLRLREAYQEGIRRDRDADRWHVI